MRFKLYNLLKVYYYLATLKTNDVRNIILKYPEYVFFNTTPKKNEILRGYYSNLPFNGQKLRTKMISKIIESFCPDVFIETGTYYGNTLEFFLKYKKPTYSIEVNEEFYLIAKSRFLGNSNLILIKGDSATELSKINSQENPTFVYLDAHWYSELPLSEELKALERYKDIIIVIDDFKIPGNDEWSYDKYGTTELEIQSITFPEVFELYFPNYSSASDGGFMTGCIVLGKGQKALDVLSSTKELSKY